ncbi:MAG: type II toxin-antitoxin system HicB family antitoxin [Ferruginibacter sp.]
MEYLVLFEKSNDGSIWARIPDLPGCTSCGENIEEARENIKEAIEIHLEAMKAEGLEFPGTQHLQAELIEISA